MKSFLRSLFLSFFLVGSIGILPVSPVLAQATPPASGPQAQFCQFTCQSGSGNLVETVDYEGGICAGGVFRPDPQMCQRRCDETCGRQGGSCARTATPRCAAAPVQWNCVCGCRPRGGGDISEVMTTEHQCAVGEDGRASGEACRSSCAAVCGQSSREYVTDRAPTCRAAQPPTAEVPSTNDQSSSGDALVGTGTHPIPSAPALSLTFPDPLGGNLTVNSLIGNIVRIVVGLVGVLFVGVFMWSGFLYLTAGGDGKQTKTAKDGITNAVLGLAVVMLSYVLVSFLIETTNRLQGDTAPTDQTASSQSTTPGRSSDTSANSSFGNTGAPATPGSPQDACRRFYGSDPSTCTTNGSCPSGVTSLEGLFALWGPTLSSVQAGGGRTAADVCRACITTEIENSQGRFPGLDNTCVPALTNFWRVACATQCSAGRTPSGATGAGGGADDGTTTNFCNLDIYNTRSSDAGSSLCNQCITYWSTGDNADVVAGVACAQPREKAAVWCGSNETRSHHQSPGYCNIVR